MAYDKLKKSINSRTLKNFLIRDLYHIEIMHVSGNNLMKEINERWDCQRELFWIKLAFLKQNC